MAAPDRYPPGVPCWIDTAQPDPEAAKAFYGPLFGWEFEDRRPPGSTDPYDVATLSGRDVAGIGVAADGPATWDTYIRVGSADEAAARVRQAGGTVRKDPFDIGAAGRMAAVADPERAAFFLWEPRAHRGAQAVNEPNTWNWSDLSSRDPAGARAFYGAVFGWEAQEMDFGGGESWMWRVPGYGDVLAQLDPGLRERHASAGVPPGFSDAIAWLQPLPDATAPHWSVTFSVAGTDPVADHALRLGGELLTPPFDAGPARLAVLQDPQGARFTISTYTPD